MVKKYAVVVFFLVVLCFAGVGCIRGGVFSGMGDGQYYDGPWRNGNEFFYYNGGAFYVYYGGEYHFHHYVPQDLQGYYEEHYRKHHEQYHRDHPESRNRHAGHPGQPPRLEEWKD